MEKLKLFMIMLVLGGLGLVGCDDNDPEGPEISATTFVAGSEPGTAELRVPEGAEVVYRFDIKSAAPISKIEVWYRPGLGANMEAPMEEKTIELYGEVSEYVVSDTLTLDEDCSLCRGRQSEFLVGSGESLSGRNQVQCRTDGRNACGYVEDFPVP